MNNNKLTLEQQNVLMNMGLDASITEKDVRDLLVKIERDNIINSHTFSKKPDKEGYYRVYVKDPLSPKGVKQFRDRNLENLKERVYKYVKEIPDNKTIITFKQAFEFALKFEKENVSKERQYSKNNTISKHQSEYKRFFEGTGFENKPIDEITLRDIDIEVRTILKRLNLSKKGMESIRGIINLTFKRSLYMGWIKENPACRIIWKDYQKLLKEPTAITERAYTNDELKKMHEFILNKQSESPSYIPAYALEFQMIVGMRRGEISPLCWEDIDFDKGTIYVHKELISQQNKTEEAEYICNYTKNGKARYYPIAEMELEFLEKLKKVHEKYYPDSKFLFPAKTLNGCITNNTVYQFFRRMCNKIGIPISSDRIRGTHAFRRHAITDVVNFSNGNCVLAAQMFGNSPETIRKHYYVGEDMEELRSILDMRKPFSDDKSDDPNEEKISSYIFEFSSYKSKNEKTPKTL